MLDPDISTAAALRHLHRPDHGVDEPFALDRRRFLQLVGMGMGAGLVAGPGTSLLDMNLPGFDPTAWAAGPIGPTDGILVIIGMYGGNDALNTVVPLSGSERSHYDEMHAPITIDPADTLPLPGSSVGLNQHLTEFKRFWDADQLAIVDGVGHGLDDFSHFSSMARWMAGDQRPNVVPKNGWIGRWLDQYLSGSKDLFAAAEIGHSLPLHMIGASSVGTTVPVGQPAFGVAQDAADTKLFDAIRAGFDTTTGSWAKRVSAAQADQLEIAETLDSVIPPNDDLPQPEIVAKLDIAARLINANLGFRVITAGWGDFDSHAGQPPMHGARMVELNAAVQQFFSRLHPDWGGRVTLMSFSEFGRTPHANAGEGSDHGSSASHFVMGAMVKGGFYGQRPSYGGLNEWDRMPTHVKMVDYYGSVLDGWLGGVDGTVLPGYGEDLGLFASGPDPAPTFPGQLLGQYVALNPTRIHDTRDATGGAPARIGPGGEIEVQVAGVNGVPADDVRAVAVNISSIRPTAGTYLTAYPTGYARPETATLNPRPGEVVPNMSVVGVGADGSFTLYNFDGEVDVTVDLMGYFRKEAAARISPLTPARILDTRFGTGAPKRRVAAGSPLTLQVTGEGGVPTSGVEAVVINLTSVNPSASGWITAWPTGDPKPVVANLSYIAGQVIPNMVMCKVGSGGTISLEASHGDVDLVADVVGCFTSDGAMLSPLSPSRLLDTREGNGAPEAPVGPGEEIELQVAGRGGVPTTAKAVVLNVTGIRPDRGTFLTIYPTGEDRPLAASLNPAAGAIAGNLVVAKVGSGGKVSIYNEFGNLNITADVTAYFV